MSHCSMKSFMKSSCSSLYSTTSSVSDVARSSAKAIGLGIKHIKQGTIAAVQPLKQTRHALSNVSSPVISNAEDDTTTDEQASIKTYELPDVIAVDLDGEGQDLDDELGSSCYSFHVVLSYSFQFTVAAKKTWRSPIYAFFKPEVKVEIHKGHVSHFFTCSAKKCKTEARGIWRYQDKGDKSLTTNLRHHTLRCFSEDTVNEAIKGESGTHRSASIFSAFAHQGQQPITYSHHAHSSPEFW